MVHNICNLYGFHVNCVCGDGGQPDNLMSHHTLFRSLKKLSCIVHKLSESILELDNLFSKIYF